MSTRDLRPFMLLQDTRERILLQCNHQRVQYTFSTVYIYVCVRNSAFVFDGGRRKRDREGTRETRESRRIGKTRREGEKGAAEGRPDEIRKDGDKEGKTKK